MIKILLSINEAHGSASGVASYIDADSTPLEKAYLRSLVKSLGCEKNPIHLLAMENSAKYEKEAPLQK